MPLDIAGNTVQTDDEGYLVDPADWSRDVAEALAYAERVELGDRHWAVIRFMREYYEQHHVAPDARFVVKYLGEGGARAGPRRNDLFQLFPYGYVKQACKIAGMRKPRSWSTG